MIENNICVNCGHTHQAAITGVVSLKCDHIDRIDNKLVGCLCRKYATHDTLHNHEAAILKVSKKGEAEIPMGISVSPSHKNWRVYVRPAGQCYTVLTLPRKLFAGTAFENLITCLTGDEPYTHETRHAFDTCNLPRTMRHRISFWHILKHRVSELRFALAYWLSKDGSQE
jgi:hypothetical protein